MDGVAKLLLHIADAVVHLVDEMAPIQQSELTRSPVVLSGSASVMFLITKFAYALVK